MSGSMRAVADPPAIAASENASIGLSGTRKAQSAKAAATTIARAARTNRV